LVIIAPICDVGKVSVLVEQEGIGVPWVFPKANILHRFIAKFLDFLIVAALYEIPLQISFLAALSYLLIADGFAEGRSVGKQLIGLQAFIPATRKGASFRESIIRNFPLAVAYLFFHVPYIGWLFVLSIVGFELLLMIGNPKGVRIGDELAKTQVLDYTIFESLEK
jgi:uncharacterized RDD family membrane protein YckC